MKNAEGLFSRFARHRVRAAGLAVLTTAAPPSMADSADATAWTQPERPFFDELPPDFFIWDDEPRYLEPQYSTLGPLGDWFIRRRRYHSGQIEALGKGLDRRLSGESYVLRNNETFLRLGAYNRISEEGDLGLEPEARFKLDVPTTEKKFRLILESDSEDLASLAEQRQQGTLSPDQREDSGFTSAALRWLSPISERWNASADVGAKLRAPPEFFTRARTWSDWYISDWRLRLDQRLFWSVQDKAIARSWFAFHRDVLDNWSFRASSETRWINRNDGFEVAETLRLQRDFGNTHFLRYRVGALGESFEDWRLTEYFADVLYRRRLHDNWLYGEIIPSVRVRREEDFDPEGTITFRIEMFFSSSGALY